MKEQDGFDELSNFAARLAEERRRLHPHQGEFAAKIGISQGRQSLFERGERELRADYLARVAEAGLDVEFIVTGQRSAGRLSPEISEVLGLIGQMTGPAREALLAVARALADPHDRAGTVHAPKSAFGSETSPDR